MNKAEKGKVMLLNLSCLVSKEKVETLGEELDKINNMEGFSVRFTGPWPPYSFVTELPRRKRKYGAYARQQCHIERCWSMASGKIGMRRSERLPLKSIG